MAKVYMIARTLIKMDDRMWQSLGTESIDAEGNKTIVVEGFPTLNEGKVTLCEQSGVELSDLIKGEDSFVAESSDGYLYILTSMDATPQASVSDTLQ